MNAEQSKRPYVDEAIRKKPGRPSSKVSQSLSPARRRKSTDTSDSPTVKRRSKNSSSDRLRFSGAGRSAGTSAERKRARDSENDSTEEEDESHEPAGKRRSEMSNEERIKTFTDKLESLAKARIARHVSDDGKKFYADFRQILYEEWRYVTDDPDDLDSLSLKLSLLSAALRVCPKIRWFHPTYCEPADNVYRFLFRQAARLILAAEFFREGGANEDNTEERRVAKMTFLETLSQTLANLQKYPEDQKWLVQLQRLMGSHWTNPMLHEILADRVIDPCRALVYIEKFESPDSCRVRVELLLSSGCIQTAIFAQNLSAVCVRSKCMANDATFVRLYLDYLYTEARIDQPHAAERLAEYRTKCQSLTCCVSAEILRQTSAYHVKSRAHRAAANAADKNTALGKSKRMTANSLETAHDIKSRCGAGDGIERGRGGEDVCFLREKLGNIEDVFWKAVEEEAWIHMTRSLTMIFWERQTTHSECLKEMLQYWLPVERAQYSCNAQFENVLLRGLIAREGVLARHIIILLDGLQRTFGSEYIEMCTKLAVVALSEERERLDNARLYYQDKTTVRDAMLSITLLCSVVSRLYDPKKNTGMHLSGLLCEFHLMPSVKRYYQIESFITNPPRVTTDIIECKAAFDALFEGLHFLRPGYMRGITGEENWKGLRFGMMQELKKTRGLKYDSTRDGFFPEKKNGTAGNIDDDDDDEGRMFERAFGRDSIRPVVRGCTRYKSQDAEKSMDRGARSVSSKRSADVDNNSESSNDTKHFKEGSDSSMSIGGRKKSAEKRGRKKMVEKVTTVVKDEKIEVADASWSAGLTEEGGGEKKKRKVKSPCIVVATAPMSAVKNEWVVTHDPYSTRYVPRSSLPSISVASESATTRTLTESTADKTVKLALEYESLETAKIKQVDRTLVMAAKLFGGKQPLSPIVVDQTVDVKSALSPVSLPLSTDVAHKFSLLQKYRPNAPPSMRLSPCLFTVVPGSVPGNLPEISPMVVGSSAAQSHNALLAVGCGSEGRAMIAAVESSTTSSSASVFDDTFITNIIATALNSNNSISRENSTAGGDATRGRPRIKEVSIKTGAEQEKTKINKEPAESSPSPCTTVRAFSGPLPASIPLESSMWSSEPKRWRVRSSSLPHSSKSRPQHSTSIGPTSSFQNSAGGRSVQKSIGASKEVKREVSKLSVIVDASCSSLSTGGGCQTVKHSLSNLQPHVMSARLASSNSVRSSVASTNLTFSSAKVEALSEQYPRSSVVISPIPHSALPAYYTDSCNMESFAHDSVARTSISVCKTDSYAHDIVMPISRRSSIVDDDLVTRVHSLDGGPPELTPSMYETDAAGSSQCSGDPSLLSPMVKMEDVCYNSPLTPLALGNPPCLMSALSPPQLAVLSNPPSSVVRVSPCLPVFVTGNSLLMKAASPILSTPASTNFSSPVDAIRSLCGSTNSLSQAQELSTVPFFVRSNYPFSVLVPSLSPQWISQVSQRFSVSQQAGLPQPLLSISQDSHTGGNFPTLSATARCSNISTSAALPDLTSLPKVSPAMSQGRSDVKTVSHIQAKPKLEVEVSESESNFGNFSNFSSAGVQQPSAECLQSLRDCLRNFSIAISRETRDAITNAVNSVTRQPIAMTPSIVMQSEAAKIQPVAVKIEPAKIAVHSDMSEGSVLFAKACHSASSDMFMQPAVSNCFVQLRAMDLAGAKAMQPKVVLRRFSFSDLPVPMFSTAQWASKDMQPILNIPRLQSTDWPGCWKTVEHVNGAEVEPDSDSSNDTWPCSETWSSRDTTPIGTSVKSSTESRSRSELQSRSDLTPAIESHVISEAQVNISSQAISEWQTLDNSQPPSDSHPFGKLQPIYESQLIIKSQDDSVSIPVSDSRHVNDTQLNSDWHITSELQTIKEESNKAEIQRFDGDLQQFDSELCGMPRSYKTSEPEVNEMDGLERQSLAPVAVGLNVQTLAKPIESGAFGIEPKIEPNERTDKDIDEETKKGPRHETNERINVEQREPSRSELIDPDALLENGSGINILYEASCAVSVDQICPSGSTDKTFTTVSVRKLTPGNDNFAVGGKESICEGSFRQVAPDEDHTQIRSSGHVGIKCPLCTENVKTSIVKHLNLVHLIKVCLSQQSSCGEPAYKCVVCDQTINFDVIQQTERWFCRCQLGAVKQQLEYVQMQRNDDDLQGSDLSSPGNESYDDSFGSEPSVLLSPDYGSKCDKKYTCIVCDRIFSSCLTGYRHLKRVHFVRRVRRSGNAPMYKCVKCDGAVDIKVIRTMRWDLWVCTCMRGTIEDQRLDSEMGDAKNLYYSDIGSLQRLSDKVRVESPRRSNATVSWSSSNVSCQSEINAAEFSRCLKSQLDFQDCGSSVVSWLPTVQLSMHPTITGISDVMDAPIQSCSSLPLSSDERFLSQAASLDADFVLCDRVKIDLNEIVPDDSTTVIGEPVVSDIHKKSKEEISVSNSVSILDQKPIVSDRVLLCDKLVETNSQVAEKLVDKNSSPDEKCSVSNQIISMEVTADSVAQLFDTADGRIYKDLSLIGRATEMSLGPAVSELVGTPSSFETANISQDQMVLDGKLGLATILTCKTKASDWSAVTESDKQPKLSDFLMSTGNRMVSDFDEQPNNSGLAITSNIIAGIDELADVPSQSDFTHGATVVIKQLRKNVELNEQLLSIAVVKQQKDSCESPAHAQSNVDNILTACVKNESHSEDITSHVNPKPFDFHLFGCLPQSPNMAQYMEDVSNGFYSMLKEARSINRSLAENSERHTDRSNTSRPLVRHRTASQKGLDKRDQDTKKQSGEGEISNDNVLILGESTGAGWHSHSLVGHAEKLQRDEKRENQLKTSRSSSELRHDKESSVKRAALQEFSCSSMDATIGYSCIFCRHSYSTMQNLVRHQKADHFVKRVNLHKPHRNTDLDFRCIQCDEAVNLAEIVVPVSRTWVCPCVKASGKEKSKEKKLSASRKSTHSGTSSNSSSTNLFVNQTDIFDVSSIIMTSSSTKSTLVSEMQTTSGDRSTEGKPLRSLVGSAESSHRDEKTANQLKTNHSSLQPSNRNHGSNGVEREKKCSNHQTTLCDFSTPSIVNINGTRCDDLYIHDVVSSVDCSDAAADSVDGKKNLQFSCPFCTETFSLNGSLSRHRRTYHSVRCIKPRGSGRAAYLYKCMKCGQTVNVEKIERTDTWICPCSKKSGEGKTQNVKKVSSRRTSESLLDGTSTTLSAQAADVPEVQSITVTGSLTESLLTSEKQTIATSPSLSLSILPLPLLPVCPESTSLPSPCQKSSVSPQLSSSSFPGARSRYKWVCALCPVLRMESVPGNFKALCKHAMTCHNVVCFIPQAKHRDKIDEPSYRCKVCGRVVDVADWHAHDNWQCPCITDGTINAELNSVSMVCELCNRVFHVFMHLHSHATRVHHVDYVPPVETSDRKSRYDCLSCGRAINIQEWHAVDDWTCACVAKRRPKVNRAEHTSRREVKSKMAVVSASQTKRTEQAKAVPLAASAACAPAIAAAQTSTAVATSAVKCRMQQHNNATAPSSRKSMCRAKVMIQCIDEDDDDSEMMFESGLTSCHSLWELNKKLDTTLDVPHGLLYDDVIDVDQPEVVNVDSDSECTHTKDSKTDGLNIFGYKSENAEIWNNKAVCTGIGDDKTDTGSEEISGYATRVVEVTGHQIERSNVADNQMQDAEISADEAECDNMERDRMESGNIASERKKDDPDNIAGKTGRIETSGLKSEGNAAVDIEVEQRLYSNCVEDSDCILALDVNEIVDSPGYIESFVEIETTSSDIEEDEGSASVGLNASESLWATKDLTTIGDAKTDRKSSAIRDIKIENDEGVNLVEDTSNAGSLPHDNVGLMLRGDVRQVSLDAGQQLVVKAENEQKYMSRNIKIEKSKELTLMFATGHSPSHHSVIIPVICTTHELNTPNNLVLPATGGFHGTGPSTQPTFSSLTLRGWNTSFPRFDSNIIPNNTSSANGQNSTRISASISNSTGISPSANIPNSASPVLCSPGLNTSVVRTRELGNRLFMTNNSTIHTTVAQERKPPVAQQPRPPPVAQQPTPSPVTPQPGPPPVARKLTPHAVAQQPRPPPVAQRNTIPMKPVIAHRSLTDRMPVSVVVASTDKIRPAVRQMREGTAAWKGWGGYTGTLGWGGNNSGLVAGSSTIVRCGAPRMLADNNPLAASGRQENSRHLVSLNCASEAWNQDPLHVPPPMRATQVRPASRIVSICLPPSIQQQLRYGLGQVRTDIVEPRADSDDDKACK